MPRIGVGADDLADAKAVDIRHHQIEDDGIGTEFDGLEPTFKTIGGGA